MRIFEKSDLPDNPNRFLFNKSKVRMPADGMVSNSRGTRLVGSLHASDSKIMVGSESASTMMHESDPTSILPHSLVLISVILFASA